MSERAMGTRRLGFADVGDETQGYDAVDWWLSSDGRWHEGAPPEGWTLAEDRRWYQREPPRTAVDYTSKSESIVGPRATLSDEDRGVWNDAEEDPGPGDWDGDDWYGDA